MVPDGPHIGPGSFGLGTQVPWDEQFVIESLSAATGNGGDFPGERQQLKNKTTSERKTINFQKLWMSTFH